MRFVEDRKLARAGAPLPCKVLHGPTGWNSSVMITWLGSPGRCRCGWWPSGPGCAGLSAAMARPGFVPVYDRGQVLIDLALTRS
jgi:hypothetical protein